MDACICMHVIVVDRDETRTKTTNSSLLKTTRIANPFGITHDAPSNIMPRPAANRCFHMHFSASYS